jgi:hypothetical protein
LHNRRKLEVAMRYLLDGTVTPPDTKLTWKNIAAVAGVSKATADRAIDLCDEFRRQIEARVPLTFPSPTMGGWTIQVADSVGHLTALTARPLIFIGRSAGAPSVTRLRAKSPGAAHTVASRLLMRTAIENPLRL